MSRYDKYTRQSLRLRTKLLDGEHGSRRTSGDIAPLSWAAGVRVRSTKKQPRQGALPGRPSLSEGTGVSSTRQTASNQNQPEPSRCRSCPFVGSFPGCCVQTWPEVAPKWPRCSSVEDEIRPKLGPNRARSCSIVEPAHFGPTKALLRANKGPTSEQPTNFGPERGLVW